MHHDCMSVIVSRFANCHWGPCDLLLSSHHNFQHEVRLRHCRAHPQPSLRGQWSLHRERTHPALPSPQRERNGRPRWPRHARSEYHGLSRLHPPDYDRVTPRNGTPLPPSSSSSLLFFLTHGAEDLCVAFLTDRRPTNLQGERRTHRPVFRMVRQVTTGIP